MYQEITSDVQVEALPRYVPEQSVPGRSYFFFAYRIKITNLSPAPIQLVSRKWLITDGHGKVQEVAGPGVVGQQPRIPPGESFAYESFCPLPTPTGNMRGSYVMLDEAGREYEVKIPLFFLRDAASLH
jgi:ApaG protein